MSERLLAVTRLMFTQVEYVAQLESEAQQIKSGTIENQELVIELHKALISAKDDQLISETTLFKLADRTSTGSPETF